MGTLLPTGSPAATADDGDGGYTGHYVLIVGFDGVRGEFILRDPATPVSELRVRAAALDQARRSFGTDEDLLIVPCGGAGDEASAEEEAAGGAEEKGGVVSDLLRLDAAAKAVVRDQGIEKSTTSAVAKQKGEDDEEQVVDGVDVGRISADARSELKSHPLVDCEEM